MAKEDIEILKQFGERLANEVRVAIPDVSGKTARSVEVEVSEDGNILTIWGAAHIGTLEEGRRPTQRSGRGDLIPQLQAWIEAKGIRTDDGKLLSPFAIAANIHKYGNTLNRIKTGVGPVNYQANPIGLKEIFNEQRLDAFLDTFAEQFLSRVSSQILNLE
jgi:hypothetical protein